MTRVPRHPETGKPLPAPPPVEDFEVEEPTVPDRWSPGELDDHLRQHAEAGQGEDDGWTFGPRKAAR